MTFACHPKESLSIPIQRKLIRIDRSVILAMQSPRSQGTQTLAQALFQLQEIKKDLPLEIRSILNKPISEARTSLGIDLRLHKGHWDDVRRELWGLALSLERRISRIPPPGRTSPKSESSLLHDLLEIQKGEGDLPMDDWNRNLHPGRIQLLSFLAIIRKSPLFPTMMDRENDPERRRKDLLKAMEMALHVNSLERMLHFEEHCATLIQLTQNRISP